METIRTTETVAEPFEGSARQTNILQLREVEGRLNQLQTVAQLLWRSAETESDEVTERAAEMMERLAREGLEHLDLVER